MFSSLGFPLRDKIIPEVSVIGQRVPYSNGPMEPEEEDRTREYSPTSTRPALREPVEALRSAKGQSLQGGLLHSRILLSLNDGYFSICFPYVSVTCLKIKMICVSVPQGPRSTATGTHHSLTYLKVWLVEVST